jgi:hypothetical protein
MMPTVAAASRPLSRHTMRILPFSTFSLACFLAPLVAVSSIAAGQRLADFRRVVVGDDASPVAQTAAEEVATFAGRIAGTKLPLIRWSEYRPDDAGLSFFVGQTAAESLLGKSLGPWKMEEWMLRTVDRGLIVAGSEGVGEPWQAKTDAGTMLAAFTLLDDHLGCRWLWPGEFGEHVPDNPAAVVPQLDVRRTPAFSIRSIQFGYPLYHKPVFKQSAQRWARRSRLAWVQSAVFGHSWHDAFGLSKGTLKKGKTEWLALVDGKRQGPQMCTSNPEVLEHMAQYVAKGKTDIVNISPSDGGGFCECENCRALDVYDPQDPTQASHQLSDRIFTYANEVARRAAAKNPAKGCGMFAYTYYNKPPLKIERLEPNLYLSFVYQAAAMRDPEHHANWLKRVEGWQRLGAKMVAREGWGNHYYFDLPNLHYEQIADNLAEAHRLGLIAAYGEGSKSFATQAPNFWMLARMLWDPARTDADGVLADYCRAAYGPAAAAMQQYWETYNRSLDEHWHERDRIYPTTGIAYANMIGSWRKLLPAAVVEDAERHLRAAEQLAPAGSIFAERLRLHRFGQDYTRTMLDLLETYRTLPETGLRFLPFSTVNEVRRTDDPNIADERRRLLERAYELGERRERLLLEHREWPGPDEGLYSIANTDLKTRPWHEWIKKELGREKPSALSAESLDKVGR